jgi:hypothetical protein
MEVYLKAVDSSLHNEQREQFHNRQQAEIAAGVGVMTLTLQHACKKRHIGGRWGGGDPQRLFGLLYCRTLFVMVIFLCFARVLKA